MVPSNMIGNVLELRSLIGNFVWGGLDQERESRT